MSEFTAPERRVSWIGGAPSGSLWGRLTLVQKAGSIGSAAVSLMMMIAGDPLRGLFTGVCLFVVLVVTTLPGPRGSLASRIGSTLRWAVRGFDGTRLYEPFDDAQWRRWVRGDERATPRERNAMRARPDGAERMVWLQDTPNTPGIAWHHALGQTPYLSVAFAVAGRLRGTEPVRVIDDGAERWGRFLAGLGGELSLARGVQALTRVLPPELAYHESWLVENQDPDVPAILEKSYRQVLDACELTALVQRHYVIVSWPLTPLFQSAAEAFAKGREGWLPLMREQIDVVYRALQQAGVGRVGWMTARQTVALMLHSQDPARPIDKVSDVHPDRMGLASRDTRIACITQGEAGEWWHATGLIRGTALTLLPRGSFWTNPWLARLGERIPRSISFQMNVVPASDAKQRAKVEMNKAMFDLRTARSKGSSDVLDAEVAADAARRRHYDLRPGQQQHGVDWVGYISVSAPSARELRRAKQRIEEQGRIGIGLEAIEWMDTMQAAAMGVTWPIGRGLKPRGASMGRKAASVLAVSGGREAHDE